MNIEKLTPILVVEAIEPCLPLWKEQLGFEKITEVPHEGALGFVILRRGSTEIMMQTLASCRADHEGLAQDLRVGDVVLYAHVDALDDADRVTQGTATIVPRRTTFYGAEEVFVRTADGHRLGLSKHANAPK